MALTDNMRHFGTSSLSIFAAVVFASCATSPTGSDVNSVSNSNQLLERRELGKGECGLFGWTADEKRSFVFYADEKSAKFVPENTVEKLTTTDAFPAFNYLDSQARPVSIRLGVGEPLVGGMRYPTASIRSLTDEGWERIMPVSIVRACQSN